MMSFHQVPYVHPEDKEIADQMQEALSKLPTSSGILFVSAKAQRRLVGDGTTILVVIGVKSDDLIEAMRPMLNELFPDICKKHHVEAYFVQGVVLGAASDKGSQGSGSSEA